MNRLLQPQEIEVFYVLPALRRELTVFMKADGKSQKQIAKLLGVTEPAVSQYMSSKRASLMKFDDTIKSSIQESSKRIVSEVSLMREVQRLLHLIRMSGIICKFHETLGGAPKNCNVCFEKDDLVQIK